jgi:hypothetical protein
MPAGSVIPPMGVFGYGSPSPGTTGQLLQDHCLLELELNRWPERGAARAGQRLPGRQQGRRPWDLGRYRGRSCRGCRGGMVRVTGTSDQFRGAGGAVA